MKNVDFEKLFKAKEEQPYLVILGAGATIAAIPDGDKNGKQSAVMNGCLKKLGLEYLLEGVEIEYKGDNIENIYSELYEKPEYSDVIEKIEQAIIDYFSDMELPDNLTIYDYLVVSLTKKDCIATFNWDPLLLEAYNRMRKITNDLPQMLFLHGNVAAGFCEECRRYGALQNIRCPNCHKPFKMTKLLYPVKNKNYDSDTFIKGEWNEFDWYCENAGLITFFGYSAPKTDKEAVNRILKAYNRVDRKLDTIEIIDIKSNDPDFQDTWTPFYKSTNGNVNYFETFWGSLLAEYPRNASWGYVNRFLRGSWNGSEISLEPNMDFASLKERLNPLLSK